MEAAEAALQQYRELNDAISLEDRQNIVVQKLADLNAAVTRAKTERIEKEALHDQLCAIQQDRAALDSFPAILANPFIQQLKAELAGLQRQQAELADKLGDRHPDLIKVRSSIKSADAKLQAEIASVVQSVRNQFLAAEAQERSLVAALEAQKREALPDGRLPVHPAASGGIRVPARRAQADRTMTTEQSQISRTAGWSGSRLPMAAVRCS